MLASRASLVTRRTATTIRLSATGCPRYRAFCSTPSAHLRDFFPIKETKSIQITPSAWPHPGYTMEQMAAVVPAHRAPKTFGDHVAWRIVQLARFFMDRATGISREQKSNLENGPGAMASKPLTEAQWLVRFVFLESVAGVPGMVGGMLRHLRSLRKLRRDNGWIETLLEESYNERMHLLTFMKMCEPGWFMRLMVMGAQGVFFNSLFVSYLIWPAVVHRFVGFLEEEAIHTYTRCLREIDSGCLPRWSDAQFAIPEIAVAYWKIPQEHKTMRDLLLYVRCDEATHRSVNHTLGNLKDSDPNPFVSKYKEATRDAPLPALKPAGWERDEVL